MVTIEIKNALLGLRKLFSNQANGRNHANTTQATVPESVMMALTTLGAKNDPSLQRELLIVHACLSPVLQQNPAELQNALCTGRLSLPMLEQLFSHPELGFEQHEILKALRLTQHFQLEPGRHPADNLPTYELARHWLSHQAHWAVQKLLNCLPDLTPDESLAEHAYMRALIACSPLPTQFQVPVRLSIEIALLADETDPRGQPLHDLENLLRARLYAVTPAQTPRDPASLILTDYRNRRLALLNHGLVSHQGALEVLQQIQSGEIEPLLGCNVLSSFIRMGLSHSDDLVFQMAELLDTHRQQLHPARLKMVVNSNRQTH